MKIYLSPKTPNLDTHHTWVSNIATLQGQLLQNEATEIICDNFLSMFSVDEITGVLDVIISKMRSNAELVISEPDFNLISRQYTRDERDIDNINSIFFQGSSLKSFLTLEKIVSLLGDKLSIEQKYFDNTSSKMTIKCRRSL